MMSSRCSRSRSSWLAWVTGPLAALTVLLCAPATAHAEDADGDGVPNDVDAFPCDPRAAAVVYAPAQGEHGMLMFEDLWPNDGDIDFNDASLTYNYILMLDGRGAVTSMRVTVNVLSIGAGLRSGVALRLPVPAGSVARATRNFDDGVLTPLLAQPDESELVLRLSNNLREVFPGADGLVNTDAAEPSVQGRAINVNIQFAAPQRIDVSAAPFDMFIFRSDEPSHQIHRPEYAGTDTMDTTLFGTGVDASTDTRHFVDAQGLPYALHVPGVTFWPREHTAIDQAFPDIVAFAASGGTQNLEWYANNLVEGALWTEGAGATLPPIPSMVGPDHPTANTSCVPWDTVQFGTPAFDWVSDIATTLDGEVVVAGYTFGVMEGNTPAGERDAYVAKVDATGTLRWARQLGTSGADQATSVAVDEGGNVYVAGETPKSLNGNTALGGYDAFVVKLDGDGEVLWTRQLGSDGNDFALGIAVAGGRVVVTGETTGDAWGANPDGLTDVLVAVLDDDGDTVWVRQYGATGEDHGRGVGVDAAGDIYVAGNTFGSFGGPADGLWHSFVLKLDTDGEALWMRKSAVPEYDWDNGISIHPGGGVSTAGYVYAEVSCVPQTIEYCFLPGRILKALGLSQHKKFCYDYTETVCNYDWDAFSKRIDADGELVWEEQIRSVESKDVASGVAVDASGNVLMAGYTSGGMAGLPAVGDVDYFVGKLSDAGELQWVRGGGSSSYDYGAAVCTAPDGAAFVGGATAGNIEGNQNAGSVDAFIVKYDADGVLQ